MGLELSIRGEFRTTIEYLVKLLEDDTFIENKVSTGWLDALIASEVRTDRPDKHLAALCGAVYKSAKVWERDYAEALAAVEKGQTPLKGLLATTTLVEFIYEEVQYKFKVLFTGPESVLVIINGSSNHVTYKSMIDGGLIILLGGKTHNVYANHENHCTILSIDGKTCLLEKDIDPTKLRSPSPGKLIRYLVEDGSHVKIGDSFAEIEVMKMYMPLLATESGVLRRERPAGAILNSGDVIASLVLDDASCVKEAKVFDGGLPDFGPSTIVGDKAHQRYRQAKGQVDCVLDGFNYDGHISLLVRNLIELLRDGDLPFLEVGQVISSLSGRIPGKLETCLLDILNEVRIGTPPGSTLDLEFVDVVVKSGVFPVEALRVCIDEFVMSSSGVEDEKAALGATLAPIVEILDVYADGIKAHETKVLVDFLARYYDVEIMFHKNSYEEVLLTLREGCRQDERGYDSVVAAARSFFNFGNRIELVLSILDQIRLSSNGHEMDISAYLPIVRKLTELKTAKVSLKAREFLLFFQMPNYTQRRSDTFDVLNSAVRSDAMSFDYDRVVKLITANYAILDVLPSFFYHEKAGISAIAMYTYILHTSQAYTINSVRHVFSMDPIVFEWEFVLRTGYKTPGEFGSGVNLASMGARSVRRGLMCAFRDLDGLESGIEGVMEVKKSGEGIESVLYFCVDGSSSKLLTKDGTAREYFHTLVQKYKSKLEGLGFKRVTFMILLDNCFPRYFTYQREMGYGEDQGM